MQDTRYDIRVFLQPAFLLCTAVLAIAASVMSPTIEKLGYYIIKKPLPLKKSLDLLDEKELAPYKVVSKLKIENDDVVQQLGTEDYIQWTLEDPNVEADSPVRMCMLFVTYYELPDRVPHVPDDCYVGAGSERISSENILFNLYKEGKKQEIPGRCLVFTASTANYWSVGSKFPVLYLFRVNGEYKGNRKDARLTLNKNIRGQYSYFSKVEWKFFNMRYGTMTYPGNKEAIAASEKLLAVILPILEKEHWPTWEK